MLTGRPAVPEVEIRVSYCDVMGTCDAAHHAWYERDETGHVPVSMFNLARAEESLET